MEFLFEPIIRIWVQAYKTKGFIFEMHGQNTLVELDENLRPLRLVYRDLDVYVDANMRKTNKLHSHFPASKIVKKDRDKLLSLKYDAYICHHLFEYLSQLLSQHYKMSVESLRSECQFLFNYYFPDAKSYFPEKSYYYSDKKFRGNRYEYIESPMKLWR